MNPGVDRYLIDGCGRCSFYQTPQCKVHTWAKELTELRRILQESELQEELKWSQPCYTYRHKNILLLTAFKDFTCIAFFQGSLLKDPNKILFTPGENSQAVRQIRITKFQEIAALESIIKTYVSEAIELEKAGAKVEFKKNPEATPEELTSKFEEDAELEKAFMALTPGRQRGYILHFSQPKKSESRMSRIEKCRSKILKGEGFNDYKKT